VIAVLIFEIQIVEHEVEPKEFLNLLLLKLTNLEGFIRLKIDSRPLVIYLLMLFEEFKSIFIKI